MPESLLVHIRPSDRTDVVVFCKISELDPVLFVVEAIRITWNGQSDCWAFTMLMDPGVRLRYKESRTVPRAIPSLDLEGDKLGKWVANVEIWAAREGNTW